MNNFNQNTYPLPMENAEASVRMEGYEVTPEMREQCERILRGEATLADCLKRLSRPLGGLSIMAYSIDPIQDNCYPGTTVLINKLDIRDETTLNEAEALATFVNASKLEQHPLEGAFDFAHYKAVHHFLFSDLYDWAGQIRTVNISKKGTRFCPAEEIEQRAELIFGRLKACNYFWGLPHDEFVEEIVDFYCAINELQRPTTTPMPTITATCQR